MIIKETNYESKITKTLNCQRLHFPHIYANFNPTKFKRYIIWRFETIFMVYTLIQCWGRKICLQARVKVNYVSLLSISTCILEECKGKGPFYLNYLRWNIQFFFLIFFNFILPFQSVKIIFLKVFWMVQQSRLQEYLCGKISMGQGHI